MAAPSILSIFGIVCMAGISIFSSSFVSARMLSLSLLAFTLISFQYNHAGRSRRGRLNIKLDI